MTAASPREQSACQPRPSIARPNPRKFPGIRHLLIGRTGVAERVERREYDVRILVAKRREKRTAARFDCRATCPRSDRFEPHRRRPVLHRKVQKTTPLVSREVGTSAASAREHECREPPDLEPLVGERSFQRVGIGRLPCDNREHGIAAHVTVDGSWRPPAGSRAEKLQRLFLQLREARATAAHRLEATCRR